MKFERLYKKFIQFETNFSKVYSVIADEYSDPVLWTEPENGYWIENEPKEVKGC